MAADHALGNAGCTLTVFCMIAFQPVTASPTIPGVHTTSRQHGEMVFLFQILIDQLVKGYGQRREAGVASSFD